MAGQGKPGSARIWASQAAHTPGVRRALPRGACLAIVPRLPWCPGKCLPACLQVFRTIAATPGKEFLLRMSMMEIYNEVGGGLVGGVQGFCYPEMCQVSLQAVMESVLHGEAGVACTLHRQI